MKVIDELKDMGYTIYESDAPDREPVDFSLSDEEDNVAWVWGANPNDVEYECNHPEVEYDDDETVGECVLCGSTCDWHYEASADCGYTIREQVPHEWYLRRDVGGLIGEYLKELEARDV